MKSLGPYGREYHTVVANFSIPKGTLWWLMLSRGSPRSRAPASPRTRFLPGPRPVTPRRPARRWPPRTLASKRRSLPPRRKRCLPPGKKLKKGTPAKGEKGRAAARSVKKGGRTGAGGGRGGEEGGGSPAAEIEHPFAHVPSDDSATSFQVRFLRSSYQPSRRRPNDFFGSPALYQMWIRCGFLTLVKIKGPPFALVKIKGPPFIRRCRCPLRVSGCRQSKSLGDSHQPREVSYSPRCDKSEIPTDDVYSQRKHPREFHHSRIGVGTSLPAAGGGLPLTRSPEWTCRTRSQRAMSGEKMPDQSNSLVRIGGRNGTLSPLPREIQELTSPSFHPHKAIGISYHRVLREYLLVRFREALAINGR